ncbi:unnamed protein product, partial [Prorocentrum cordatum]
GTRRSMEQSRAIRRAHALLLSGAPHRLALQVATGGGQDREGRGKKKKKKKKEKAVPPNCQRLTVNNSAPGHGEAQMPLGHSKAGRRSRYTDQGSAHVARGS